MAASIHCPKCNGVIPSTLAESTDSPQELARTCAGMRSCLYVPCDDINCRAKEAPDTREEWRDAAIHWRRHRYMSGCSHGG